MLRKYLPSVPPLLFALVFVNVLSSKSLHLLQHVQSLPVLYLVLYSPTLILWDLFVIFVSRMLLVWPETRLRWIPFLFGGFIAILTWFAAAVQFGFFFETGAEVEWSATDSFVRDPAAMKILMSGISSVTAAGTVFFLASFVLSGRLYSITGRWLDSLWDRCWQGVREPKTLLPFAKSPAGRRCAFQYLLPLAALSVSLMFLEATRPSIPYDHLARALPLTMLDAFHRPVQFMEGCRPPPLPFPLPPHRKGGPPPPPPHHHHHHPFDWAFGKGPPPFPPPPPPPPPLGDFGVQPSWLPEDPPPGFSRWQPARVREEEHGDQPLKCPSGPFQYYNPRSDPLKISNFDDDIMGPLQQVFKDDNPVEINHVVLLTLESGRKEVFPMQSGTPMYDYLVESHEEKERKDAIDKLSKMTPVAQMLTGEYALNSEGKVNDFSNHKWHDKSEPGMGGLNVKGGLTASSLTLKSILGSHCGVSPLPVDLLEEINLEFYQPCLPQIFELFNRHKSNESELKDGGFQGDQWKSVYVQSSTVSYDRQDKLNEAMGFNHSISRESLKDPDSKHWPPATGEINYFGYAESETRPYLRDLIFDAAENKTRLFLSHLTSSTHHPWRTPKTFHTEQYTGDQGSVDHDSMNDYLNTVRYVDDWLGEILGLLDEAGIANSTLVVIIGDHGQAFSEDAKVTGTFENGHISNFHVPIVFRHPHLPHIDISANATSLAILPTILDLLVQSQSLNEKDSAIASSLFPEYQGQSLLRPFHNERPDDGLAVWNFALINGGGSMLAITSANSPYRLILPLKEEFNYRFTHLGKDPRELKPLEGWSMPRLVDRVRKDHGEEAAAWLMDAERVGRWWVAEQKRIWDYRRE